MNIDELLSELKFKAVRSSGAGGQHVNKVSSKVILQYNVSETKALSEDELKILLKNIGAKLTKDKVLILSCDESRSQHKNKELVIKRFIDLVQEGLIVPKKRVPTKTPKAVVKKRLESKQKQSDIKGSRKKPELE